MSLGHTVTCSAPVNIAVIKYWGKRDESLILPVNSSVSVTLHQDQLRAKTTVAVCKAFTKDRMWLNGKEQSMKNPRLQSIITEIKRRARKVKTEDRDTAMEKINWNIHICSENNFPTAAGLASSAAGYACLVYALSKLYNIDGDISEIARQGSGSACRSVFGGFVEWNKGEKDDGTDSLAKQIKPESHWPDLHVLILVVNDHQKHTASTEGMQTTVNTSQLLQQRIQTIPDKLKNITQAIEDKNFQIFADITMKDSNQLHAVCLDTYPPISYMTDVSHSIVRLVHRYNRLFSEIKVSYTFDAGPNACLFLLKKDVARFYSLLNNCFPPSSEDKSEYLKGLPIEPYQHSQEDMDALSLLPQNGALKYVIHTKSGPGPKLLTDDESLLGLDGFPK